MRVWIIRHGKADRDSDTGRDEDRRLAVRGERQAERLGAWLAEAEATPEVIYASPVERARRTGEILSEESGIELQQDDRLSTSGAVSSCLELIEQQSSRASIAIVGHNPTLENLVGVLVHGAGDAGVRLRTGEAAPLELDPESGVGSARLLEMVRFDD